MKQKKIQAQRFSLRSVNAEVAIAKRSDQTIHRLTTLLIEYGQIVPIMWHGGASVYSRLGL